MLKTISLLAFVVLTSSCATIEQNITPPTSNQITKNSVSSKDGLVTVKSNYSVKETADRFESIANGKGLTLFTRIDHQKNAAGVNLTLRPTEVIIFGNPKAGTPLMQCAQNVAIDLPQKVLISEDATGAVHLSYNDPEYLKARHNIKDCDKVLNTISTLLSHLTTAATTK